jgi:hypothetical protein
VGFPAQRVTAYRLSGTLKVCALAKPVRAGLMAAPGMKARAPGLVLAAAVLKATAKQ